MNNKDLIARFVKDSYRFEALHGEIDSHIADVDSEILAYEYEDLANQAAEIVLKLSANGKNLGLNFYRYYVKRLEYIIDYFRALLDDEETPLAEDKQDELDDEKARAYRGIGEFFGAPAEIRFEGAPADCAFPKSPEFYFKNLPIKIPVSTYKFVPAAADEADAVEEDDSEDKLPEELDDENDAQTAERDEAADDPAASAPISEEDMLLPPGVELITGKGCRCWVKLSSKVRAEVRETFGMWEKMNEITGRYNGAGIYAEAVKVLDDAERCFYDVQDFLKQGYPLCLEDNEQGLRKKINRAIDAIPDFRNSEEFKELIERYPTYKEKEQ